MALEQGLERPTRRVEVEGSFFYSLLCGLA